MVQLLSWTKIRTIQWFVLNASAFQCMRAPNVTILLFYIPVKINMSFIWWRWFFFLPRSASSVSRSRAHFPSVIQAYIQPYSFSEGIKLIICQIRHELSVIIHEKSTSWKKMFDDGSNRLYNRLLQSCNITVKNSNLYKNIRSLIESRCDNHEIKIIKDFPSYYIRDVWRVKVADCSGIQRNKIIENSFPFVN